MRKKSRVKITVPVIVVLILVLLGALIAHLIIDSAPSKSVIDALVAVSQVGGVVSGFTLTATAILSLGGQYREYVLKSHGKFVTYLLLLSFAISAIAAMICAVSPLISSARVLVCILGASVTLIFGSLVTTALLFYGAYSWEAGGPIPEKKKTSKPMDL
ncbi:hypothetical protein QP920_10370 [Corynebacterium marquesiae]|uniref:hypothetical protein n=1 Tax=Corynebacterium marquesiae TaxID=2913503 RepID=UPI00254C356C|nr:hypothetical protein [Corynebacterium marquesiae]MDK8496846.1 hypothetical protein [Corynebacterium marquesiae]